MDNYILIAVGGTGARIAQSVVALAAGGLLHELKADDNEKQLLIKLVDIDRFHKDGNELYDMIEAYNKAIGGLLNRNYKGAEHWKPLKINIGDEEHFIFDAKIGDADTNTKTIDEKMRGVSADAKLLLHSLLSREDREMDLSEGCKARPRIGALLWEGLFKNELDNHGNFKTNSWWGEVYKNIGNGNTYIMFAGSVFGGTGASGVPTLAKLIKNKVTNDPKITKDDHKLKYGITLMTPYFELITPKTSEAKVQASLFPLESKMAMEYYQNDEELMDMDCVQIVADTPVSMRKWDENKEGCREEPMEYTPDDSADQDNPSMAPEVIAAAGIFQFFADKKDEKGNELKCPIVHGYDRNAKDGLSAVLPGGNDTLVCLYRLIKLCEMLSYYRIFATGNARRYEYMPPLFHIFWEDDVLKGQEWKNSWVTDVGALDSFTKRIHRWLGEIDCNGFKGNLNLERNHVNVKRAANSNKTDFVLGSFKYKKNDKEPGSMKGNSITKNIEDAANKYIFKTEDESSIRFTKALLQGCE